MRSLACTRSLPGLKSPAKKETNPESTGGFPRVTSPRSGLSGSSSLWPVKSGIPSMFSESNKSKLSSTQPEEDSVSLYLFPNKLQPIGQTLALTWGMNEANPVYSELQA